MHRLVLQELRSAPGAVREIASFSGISEAEVLVHLRELNDKVKSLLGYEDDPITTSSSGALKADGVAGLLRLNASVELEVVPKFLDPASPTWRSDFFLLAVLVKTGHLLLHDEISAGTQDRGDLAMLIARSFLTLYTENERRPIRGYRRGTRADFALDGDVDWETVFLPDPDGFAVSQLELTRQNAYNATLAAAVRILIPEVADVDMQAQLRLLGRHLAPQGAAPAFFPPLPPRHRGWQQAYELASLIVTGLGLNLDGGVFSGPGFVLSTWSAWEFLCEELVRRALPDYTIVGQKQWVLGHRDAEEVYAKPDISPITKGAVPLLLDAKYKTRFGKSPRINAGDLYESLAFLRAVQTDHMLLLYPSVRPPDKLALGEWHLFDQINVDQQIVQGFEIQIQGLARRGGFEELVTGARLLLNSKLGTVGVQ
ncbi:5-methylcytosine restriction system specificity protein McrC [Luteococcus sp. OSA5]|uniref:5-methylcytosine restriction system specificity protein McrC n=1 Tax=Luteococcus sp. OSA5 TaxID=3401630 RepID=UPI003B42A3D1